MNEKGAGGARLERTIGWVLRIGVTTSSVCLASGLALELIGFSALANVLLQTGIVVLLATPAVRVLVSIVEYVSERDWEFVALTAVVLVELMGSVVAALVFNRRM